MITPITLNSYISYMGKKGLERNEISKVTNRKSERLEAKEEGKKHSLKKDAALAYFLAATAIISAGTALTMQESRGAELVPTTSVSTTAEATKKSKSKNDKNNKTKKATEETTTTQKAKGKDKTNKKGKGKKKGKVEETTVVETTVDAKREHFVSTIDKDFANHRGSVLKGMGSKLYDIATSYGVEPALFGAIICNETGYGTSRAIKNKNNPGGIMKASGGLRTYNTLDEGLNAMASLLKRRYIDEGLTTVSAIGKKYCPGSDNGAWTRVVSQLYNKYSC